MGSWLNDHQINLDRILGSTAKRVQETIDLMQTRFALPIEVVLEERLYLAGPETILQTIQETPDLIRTLLVLGHNPGMSLFASALAKDDFELSTAAIVWFEMDAATSWNQLDFTDSVRMVRSIRPKQLAQD
jgi:phosphohistidine phosphatase